MLQGFIWRGWGISATYPGAFIGVEYLGIGEDEPEVLEKIVRVGISITQQVFFNSGKIHGVLYDVEVILKNKTHLL